MLDSRVMGISMNMPLGENLLLMSVKKAPMCIDRLSLAPTKTMGRDRTNSKPVRTGSHVSLLITSPGSHGRYICSF